MTARIGIDLGGTKISGVVLDAAGGEVVRIRLRSPRDDYPATLAALEGLVSDLEAAAAIEPGAARVGIGTPGSCHPRRGIMANCNSTWLNDRPLREDLSARLGPRVRLANDADCLGLSEARDGAGAGFDVVFAVILGTGVGGAVVAGGRPWSGPNGLGGEWGHVPLPYFRQRIFAARGPGGGEATAGGSVGGVPADEDRYQVEFTLDDRPCYCGRRNCIERFLSGPGLVETHRALWEETLGAEVIAAARTERAAHSMALYRHMLARSLAQVVTVLDPGVIVLGGGLSNVPGLVEALTRLVPAFAFSSLAGADAVEVEVRTARWGDDSGVRGAARLWDDAVPD